MQRPHTTIDLPYPLCVKGSTALVAIDEQLAPILSILWNWGVETEFCCQGNAGIPGYILFRNAEGARRFLDCLCLESDIEESLGSRIIRDCHRRGTKTDFGKKWSIFTQISRTPTGVALRTTVDFPNKDIPAILERLRRKTQ